MIFEGDLLRGRAELETIEFGRFSELKGLTTDSVETEQVNTLL